MVPCFLEGYVGRISKSGDSISSMARALITSNDVFDGDRMRDVKGGNVESPPPQSVYTFESVGQDTSKRRNITGMTVNSTRDSNKPSLSIYW